MKTEVAPVVRLDEHTHRYYMNEARVLGFTEVAQAVGIIDPSNFSAEAAIRGHDVHRIAELMLLDDLEESSVAPEYEGYAEGIRIFIKDHKFDPIAVEQVMGHPTYRYGFKPDAVGMANGVVALVDFKTGKEQKWWAMQLEFYECGWNKIFPEYKIQDRFDVELDGCGGYRIVRRKDPGSLSVILNALSVAQWRLKNGSLD